MSSFHFAEPVQLQVSWELFELRLMHTGQIISDFNYWILQGKNEAGSGKGTLTLGYSA